MGSIRKNRPDSEEPERPGRDSIFRNLTIWGLMICLMIWGGLVWSGIAGVAAATAKTGQDVPELTEGFIYFRDGTEGHLTAVSKFFPADLDVHELGLALLEALTAGPHTPELQPLLPQGSRVNALFITPGGNAYVDLKLPRDRLARPDTISELLAVYSLVNSLALNIPEISRVKILVNGAENGSLGGHVSLAPFFKPNMLIVK